jgi:hypothetical protein
MEKSEAALVVAKAIAYDGRLAKKDELAARADVERWHEAIGDLALPDCLAAVAGYYRENSGWIMPADVRQRVQAIREYRLATVPVPEIPRAIVDNPRAHLAAHTAAVAAIMNGDDPLPAMREIARQAVAAIGPA